MTHFEYISVAVSIVLALSIARLLDGVGPALRADGRYWVHVGWMAQKFTNILLWWWSLWIARATDWNLALFIYELIGPIVIYLQCKALVTPSELHPTSWFKRFYEIRIWFFVGNLVLISSAFLGPNLLEFEQEIGIPYAAFALLFAASLLGLIFQNPRVHAWVVFVALAIQLLGLGGSVFAFG